MYSFTVYKTLGPKKIDQTDKEYQMDYYTTSPEEKTYLRELARKQLAYANLPEMAERKKAWFAHNRVEGYRTMVVMEENSFWSDVRPAARCTNGAARLLEDQLQQHIFAHEMIGDDKVVPDTVSIQMKIGFLPFGLSPNRKHVEGSIGYHIEPVITELTTDLPNLGPSVFTFNADGTELLKSWAGDLVGDILPPRVINTANNWAFGATQRVVDFMGMESMLISMVDEPEAFHQFMQMIADDLIRFLRWQEQNNLLLLNNGNDYMGSGSFCFSDEYRNQILPGRSEASTPGAMSTARRRSASHRPCTTSSFIHTLSN